LPTALIILYYNIIDEVGHERERERENLLFISKEKGKDIEEKEKEINNIILIIDSLCSFSFSFVNHPYILSPLMGRIFMCKDVAFKMVRKEE